MPVVQGLSAFPITPSGPDGRVDVAALRRLVAPLAAAGVDSIGLLGSTGSYPYLTRAERRRALDAALAEAGGRVPILVGVGALRTDEAVRLTEDARDAGGAVGLLAAVSYTPLGDDEVFEHVAAVARARLPLCLYDNPSTTHFAFTPALVERLARLDGVVALKSPAPAPDAVAAHLDALRRATPDGFSVGCSVDWHAAEALLAGGGRLVRRGSRAVPGALPRHPAGRPDRATRPKRGGSTPRCARSGTCSGPTPACASSMPPRRPWGSAAPSRPRPVLPLSRRDPERGGPGGRRAGIDLTSPAPPRDTSRPPHRMSTATAAGITPPRRCPGRSPRDCAPRAWRNRARDRPLRAGPPWCGATATRWRSRNSP